MLSNAVTYSDVLSRYLNGAPCWTVHPPRTGHLDLVAVRSGAPVSVTPRLHGAGGRGKLTLRSEQMPH